MISKKLICVLIALVLFSFTCSAAGYYDSDFFDEQLEAVDGDRLFDELTPETKKLLNGLGLTDINFETVFSPSPRRIFDLFFQIIRNEYSKPLEVFLILAAVVIILSAFSRFFDGSGNMKSMQFFSSVIAALIIIVPLSACITRVVSAINASSDFVLALVPVLAAVITASGNPTLALSYNSLSFTAAQLTAALGSDFIRPVVQVVMSLSVVSSLTDAVNIKPIVELLKKTAVFFLSFSATVFITMLTLKAMLASAADNVAVRGIRFLISSVIPVIGGAVSDAYLSVIGTLSLVKNTVAVFGIAAVAVINLPVIAECVMWIFFLGVLASIGDLFARQELSELFRSISSGLVLLNVVLLFEFLIFVLSTGLVLLIGGKS